MKTKIIIFTIIGLSILSCNSEKKSNTESQSSTAETTSEITSEKTDFNTDNTILEKYWKLKTLQGQDVTMAENQEREIFFTLKTNNNRVTGFAGCNTIGGAYTLEEGNRIHFTKMLSSKKACPDVDLIESKFLKVFELTDNYTIKDDVLSLNVGRRAPLAVFEAVYMQ